MLLLQPALHFRIQYRLEDLPDPPAVIRHTCFVQEIPIAVSKPFQCLVCPAGGFLTLFLLVLEEQADIAGRILVYPYNHFLADDLVNKFCGYRWANTR